MVSPPTGSSQKDAALTLGERHVERADLQRHEVVPEPGEQREDHQEDHDRPVHGEGPR
jgi:hypothetical protein